MDSVEAAVAWQPAVGLQLGLNVFRYRMRDILRHVPNADPTTGATAQNSGEQTGTGFEFEAAWDVSRTLRLSGHHAYQRSIDEATQQNAGMAPRHHTYLRADWRFASGWLFNAQVNRVADRQREPGDTRPKIADYTTVDFTLRAQRGRTPWDVAFSVRNAFNADVREPSPAPGLIPNDFPLPRRHGFVEARYAF